MLMGLGALVKKEFIQFFRDKFLFILVMYVFIGTLIYGPTLTLEVQNMPVGVYDLDRSAASRALIQEFQNVKNFNLKYYTSSGDELDRLLAQGSISLGLVIPPGYAEKMAGGMPARVQLIADGSNSVIATTALGYASRLIRSVSRQIEVERLGLDSDAANRLPGISNNIRALYDPELDFLKLGLLTMVTNSALVSGVFLALTAMVREKEAGTMDQLMVTPVTPGKLILAKLLPMSVVQMLGLGTALAGAILFFHSPVKGSLFLFGILSVVHFFAAMGIGVFVSTFVKNMQQALIGLFLIVFPLIYLSGNLVPIKNMPAGIQYFTYLNPLVYYTRIVIGIFLKGVGMEVLWPQAAALGIYALVILTWSTVRFKKGLA